MRLTRSSTLKAATSAVGLRQQLAAAAQLVWWITTGSQMAFAQHTGSGTHSLSHDFAYAASDVLSFDMHAVANPRCIQYASVERR